MQAQQYEELIQLEAERLSEELFGAAYFDLAVELRLFVRARAIGTLWPDDGDPGFTAAA